MTDQNVRCSPVKVMKAKVEGSRVPRRTFWLWAVIPSQMRETSAHNKATPVVSGVPVMND